MTREQMLVCLVPFTSFNGLGLVIAATNNLRVTTEASRVRLNVPGTRGGYRR